MFFVNFNIFPSVFFSSPRQNIKKLRQIIRGEKQEGNSITSKNYIIKIERIIN